MIEPPSRLYFRKGENILSKRRKHTFEKEKTYFRKGENANYEMIFLITSHIIEFQLASLKCINSITIFSLYSDEHLSYRLLNFVKIWVAFLVSGKTLKQMKRKTQTLLKKPNLKRRIRKSLPSLSGFFLFKRCLTSEIFGLRYESCFVTSVIALKQYIIKEFF